MLWLLSLFLNFYFWTMLPSMGIHNTSDVVRGVFDYYYSSILPSLWGLWLIHPDLVLITFGPALCTTHDGMFMLFISILSCCMHMLLWCPSLVVFADSSLFITFIRSLVCDLLYVHVHVVCIDCMKCHSLYGQCSRMWLVFVFYFLAIFSLSYCLTITGVCLYA